MGRRRVLFRRQSRRRGEGLSLPTLSRQSLLKEWRRLSKKEREERRRQVIEKYYKGSYSAFERDVEARPFHVLRLMLTAGAEPAVPAAVRPPEKPKAERSAKKKVEAPKEEPRVERPPEEPKPVAKPKPEKAEEKADVKIEIKPRVEELEAKPKPEAPKTIEEIGAEVWKRVKLHKFASKKYGFGEDIEKHVKQFKTVEDIDKKLKELENDIRMLYGDALKDEREATDAHGKMRASAAWMTVGYHLLLRDRLLQRRRELLEGRSSKPKVEKPTEEKVEAPKEEPKKEEPKVEGQKPFPKELPRGYVLKDAEGADYAFYEKKDTGPELAADVTAIRLEKDPSKAVFRVREMTKSVVGNQYLIFRTNYFKTLEDAIGYLKGEKRVYPPKRKPELVRPMSEEELKKFLEEAGIKLEAPKEEPKKEEAKVEEAKHETPTPEPEAKPKVLTKDVVFSAVGRINERFSDTRLAHIIEELKEEGYSIDELEDLLMELKKEGKIEWRPDGVIWTTEYAKKARERIGKALSEMAKPKAEAPKTEYAPGTWVKLKWHRYPQLVVEKTGEGYRLWDEWEVKWREVSPRDIEGEVRPDPSAPHGSPEEMASRVKAEELLEEVRSRREAERQERLRMLELWLQRVKTTGERDPRDPFKTLPPDHPLSKLQAEKIEAEIKLLKGSISEDEYRSTVERIEAERERVRAQLETEKPKVEEKREELSPVEARVLSVIEKLNRNYGGPIHPNTVHRETGMDYEDVELAVDGLISKGLIERDDYGVVWSKKWDAEVSANKELVYNALREHTARTYGEGVTFDELAKEMEQVGVSRKALNWLTRKLLDEKRIRVLYTPSGSKLAVPPEPGMFNYREAKDSELERLRNAFRNRASSERTGEGYEKYMDEVRKIDEELARRRERMESYKRDILEKAKAGTLTYETTPDRNPFRWDTESEEYLAVSPYINAKERTDRVAKIMEALGEKPDREKIFRDYLEYYRRRSGVSSTEELRDIKEPYEEYFERSAEAHQMTDSIRNLVEKNIWAWGDARISKMAEELGTDIGTVKLAVKQLVDEYGYRIRDWRTWPESERIKSPEEGLHDHDYVVPPKGWKYLHDYDPKGRRKPDTRGLRALEKLGFPLSGHREGEGILEIGALGKAKLEFLDPSCVTLFRGEVDLSDLKLEPGRYKLRLGDGDRSAVTSPHTIVREEGENGEIVLTFKRFDSESRGEKVMREMKLYATPTNEKPREPPEIKTRLTAKIMLNGKALKDLLRKAGPDDVLEFAIEDGKAVARVREYMYGQKLATATGDVLDTATGKETARVNIRNLEPIADLLKPSDVLVIHLSSERDKPVKAVIDTDFISGEYWIAPYIADNW